MSSIEQYPTFRACALQSAVTYHKKTKNLTREMFRETIVDFENYIMNGTLQEFEDDEEESQPYLGLATTRELLEELKARLMWSGQMTSFRSQDGAYTVSFSEYRHHILDIDKMLNELPMATLDYRTVGYD